MGTLPAIHVKNAFQELTLAYYGMSNEDPARPAILQALHDVGGVVEKALATERVV